MALTYFAEKLSSSGGSFRHCTPNLFKASEIANRYCTRYPRHWIRLGVTYRNSDYIFYAPEQSVSETKDIIKIYQEDQLVYNGTSYYGLGRWAKYNLQKDPSLKKILLYNYMDKRITSLYFYTEPFPIIHHFYEWEADFRFFNPHEVKPLQIDWQKEGF